MAISSGLGGYTSPGLVLVKSQTVGSAVSSVTVSNAFSSAYDNYKIIYHGGTGSVTTSINMTLGSTTSGYQLSILYFNFSTSSGTANAIGNSNASNWLYVGGMSSTGVNVSLDLYGPNLSARTMFGGFYTEIGTSSNAGHVSGYLNDATQYTSFTLTANSGTLTGGVIRVYGYRN